MDARSDSTHRRLLRRRAPIAILAALAALGLLTTRALAADMAVEIANFAFAPGSVTVNVGDTVTWTNNDSAPHTATADDGSFDTGQLAQGDSGEATFDTAGTFAYHCAVHPTMTGTVVVEAAAAGGGAPAVTTPPTDTVAPAPGGSADILGALVALAAAFAVALALAVRRRRAAG